MDDLDLGAPKRIDAQAAQANLVSYRKSRCRIHARMQGQIISANGGWQEKIGAPGFEPGKFATFKVAALPFSYAPVAVGGGRTRTSFRSPAFEAGVSSNSTTTA